MPGPGTIFTTLGAVGACGAAAYVTKNNRFSSSLSRNQLDSPTVTGNNFSGNTKISKLATTNKKLRIGHRSDLHTLTFVMGKD